MATGLKWAQRVGKVLTFACGVGIVVAMVRSEPTMMTTPGRIMAGAVALA